MLKKTNKIDIFETDDPKRRSQPSAGSLSRRQGRSVSAAERWEDVRTCVRECTRVYTSVDVCGWRSWIFVRFGGGGTHAKITIQGVPRRRACEDSYIIRTEGSRKTGDLCGYGCGCVRVVVVVVDKCMMGEGVRRGPRPCPFNVYAEIISPRARETIFFLFYNII